MVFRKLLFISFALIGFVSQGLNAAQSRTPIIKLSSNNFNLEHPYYKLLAKKDADYIEWLYYRCASKTIQADAALESKPLVFSITYDGVTRFDTIANCVQFKVYEDERTAVWKNEVPIYGSLPSNVKGVLTNVLDEGCQLKLNVENDTVDANIYILNEEGEHVRTLANKKLRAGEYNFNWDANEIKEGRYLLYANIDNHLVIYQIEVSQNWFLNLFKNDKSKPGRVIYRSVDDSPQTDLISNKQLTFVHHNRFGTSVGVHLLSEAMVNIELLTIKGESVTKIINRRLPKGENSFAVSDKVVKPGAYLVRISINKKVEYINTNIQK